MQGRGAGESGEGIAGREREGKGEQERESREGRAGKEKAGKGESREARA